MAPSPWWGMIAFVWYAWKSEALQVSRGFKFTRPKPEIADVDSTI